LSQGQGSGGAPLPVAELVERQTALSQACNQIERVPIPTCMSFRAEFSTITGNAPASGGKRPVGHGTPAGVASDLLSYREKAGLDRSSSLKVLRDPD
jgi:hypothetical protein